MLIKFYMSISAICAVLFLVTLIYIIKDKKVLKQVRIDKNIQKLKHNKISEIEVQEGETQTFYYEDEFVETLTFNDLTEADKLEKQSAMLYEGQIVNKKYKIESILGSGAQGSVYVCTNLSLGNKWALKHFNGSDNEKEILVKLNHMSLPKISDIFRDESGSYIVESFVEGESLDSIMKNNSKISEDYIIDWSIQICEALSYIHNKNVLHMDIKPQNIIITAENKAILIDFGIATTIDEKRQNVKVYGYSPMFCSPEQKNKRADSRSDIYSVGATLFYILTRSKPQNASKNHYSADVSKEFSHIIEKCLCENPNDRYKNVTELIEALISIKQLKVKKEKIIYRNKVLRVVDIALLVVGIASCGYGNYLLDMEKLSVVTLSPSYMVMSEQQSEYLNIEQQYKNGKTRSLPANEIKWSSSDEAVAKIENGKIMALNEGRTEIEGKYLNKIFTMSIVVSGKEQNLSISLKYNSEYKSEEIAGNGERDVVDEDNLKEASFLEPKKIAVTNEGTIYAVDRYLREIKDGQVKTIDTSFIQPSIVKCASDGSIYIASMEWYTENQECKAGIFKIEDHAISPIWAIYTYTEEITDFAFYDENTAYAIVTDYASDKSKLYEIDIHTSVGEILLEDEGLNSLAVASDKSVYISQGKNAVIYKLNFNSKKLDFFAGKKHEKAFIDGKLCRFYYPSELSADKDGLLLRDYNLIRKITIKDGEIKDVETIAGDIYMYASENVDENSFISIPAKNSGICILGESIYYTNSESNKIMRLYK